MNESKKKDRYEDAKKFVRYSDGAKMYSMGMTKFQEVAIDKRSAKVFMLSTSNKEVYGTFRNYLEIYFMILENNFDV